MIVPLVLDSLFLLQGTSQLRNRTGVSCIVGRFFTSWNIWEALRSMTCFEFTFSEMCKVFVYCHFVASAQFSSVAQSCLTLSDPMGCSAPGFPVHHHLPELAQTHVLWVGDAIQSSHPLLSPCPALNLSQHQGLFPRVSSLHQGPKYWSFGISISPSNEYSGLISITIDWFGLAVQETLKSLLQHHSSKVSVLWCSTFSVVQLSYPYMTTGKTIALTRGTFAGKIMSLLFNKLSRLVIAFLPRSKCFLISWLQAPFAEILEPKKIKSVSISIVSPSICHAVMGLDAMISVFWMSSFKLAFLLSSFSVIKRLFSSSLHSTIRVVSSAYLRLLIFPPAILIPAGASSSLAFHVMCSAYKLNKWDDNILAWHTSFPTVCCSMFSSNCCFLTCIQISQKTGKVVLCCYLLKNFLQFVVIHTVKGFGVVSTAEVDVFMELFCFFYYPMDVGIWFVSWGYSVFAAP